ncbi:hypothetical protein Pelo_18361 [Pelomyxa schiedti]|nr:hypothetical protein Pelo_18361 [Pelomyxa schiedti]
MATWRGHLVRVVKQMRDVSCAKKAHISSIPDHPKVAKFIGLILDTDKESVGKVMECSNPRVPTHLEEALGDKSMTRLNSTPFLGPLLKICIQKGNRQLLEQVLSITLREKILKDIAHGLCHLHGLVPPVIANLDVGNILVISLDESQPGPYVKKEMKIGDYFCTQTELPSARPCWSPEEAAQRTPLLNTQTDVWRFGVLTHRVIDPLTSSVELQINSRELPGDSSPGPGPRTQRVKLRQLGTALFALQQPPAIHQRILSALSRYRLEYGIDADTLLGTATYDVLLDPGSTTQAFHPATPGPLRKKKKKNSDAGNRTRGH